jgi:hypothetical protein
MMSWFAVALVALLAPTANPAWEKMKTLVGTWEGTAHEGGNEMLVKATFRLVSAGSTLMNVMDEGSPHEMVTMYHQDLKDLVATHYCSAQNQPRMRAVTAPAPNQVAFDFKDGTNIAPGSGHMQHLVITFVDADHHVEEWTYRDKGKDHTNKIEYHRKK